MILDTNAVSAIFSGNQYISKILSKSPKHHLPVIVSGEYRFGLLNSTKQKELENLLEILEKESYVLDVNTNTSKHYSVIRQQLKSNGTPIPENDIWIAALAAQYKQKIISKDTHFDYVKGIQRVEW